MGKVVVASLLRRALPTGELLVEERVILDISSILVSVELNPIKLMSSSVILLNIFRISSGVSLITIFGFRLSPTLLYCPICANAIPSSLILSGCLHPHPCSVCSPHLFIFDDMFVI
jgi:hypothetical protein